MLLGVAGVYCVPVLLTYIANGEQDQCTFGSVSNEQYRAYLQQAKVLSSETPGGFSWDDVKASTRLDQLFEKMIDGNPSVYERVAASHALLRSFGAQYRNTFDMRPAPYETVAKKGGVVSFNYYLNVNRLGLFHPLLPFFRTTYVNVHLFGPGHFYTGLIPSIAGDIRFHVQYPVLDNSRPVDERAPENCPLVPNLALSDSFSRIAK
ncbi:hypothetical protein LJR220_001158 [Bradyrhizobium sp. LjRoot220]|uniref:hypothetical protein n=1 Tax=Bradyrhizobium sp. LjRoot220 TaxID=3342284 RepID=UPI003ED15FA9